MIENAVEQYSDTVLMQGIANTLEALVVTQTAVDLFVVDGIIAVLCALKYRIEQDTVDAHLLEMGDKVNDLVQSVVQLKIILFRRSAKAERINVVDHGIVYPMHDNTSFGSVT